MKYLKILGLAAVAAMALMAFAGTASATTLCKVDPVLNTACPASSDHPAGTTTHAVSTGPGASGKAVLKSGGIILDECNSTVQGTTSNTSGTTITGNVSTLSWTNCSVPTTTLATGVLHIAWIEGTYNGTVTGSGQQVTVSTGPFGNCTFGTASTGTHLGTLTASKETLSTSAATMAIKATVPLIKSESGLCPASATWTASYDFTTPKPLFVTS